MDREYYLDFAARGLRMPIGADMVLRERPDHAAIMLDGVRLGRVIEETARRYGSPLAFPLMDLTLEKRSLLERIAVPSDRIDAYHFAEAPDDSIAARIEKSAPFNARVQANAGAIRYIANETDLLPIGMTIGPFSLTTKLLTDPITPVYLSGTGLSADDDPEVKLLDWALATSTRLVLEMIDLQLAAGAKAIFIAEPAANKVFFSPNQLAAGSDVFERYVMAPNRLVKKRLLNAGADLMFHCCGELIDSMLTQFGTLDPALLSLGSSRVLWDDARLMPKSVVLYGNLPSKKFYSDDAMTIEQVERLACELIARMGRTNHPFILGTECDVLSVPGSEKTIRAKIDAFVRCHGC